MSNQLYADSQVMVKNAFFYLGEWAIASHGIYESHQVFGAAESGKYEMILPVHHYNPRVCS